MELSPELKDIFIETGQELKGYTRRIFQAKVVKLLGQGGQRQAEAELGWNRDAIRKSAPKVKCTHSRLAADRILPRSAVKSCLE